MAIGGTAVFVGYLTVWLPGPAAGLRFLGVELGEWIKFLGVGLSRNLFYLPPITLGLALALWSGTWTRRGWRPWALRGTAVLASLLSFPAIEAILYEPADQWVYRLLLIGLVVGVALGAHWLSPRWARRLLVGVGAAGLALPTGQYLLIRPLVAQVVGEPVGVGVGVWLNGLGHLLWIGAAVRKMGES